MTSVLVARRLLLAAALALATVSDATAKCGPVTDPTRIITCTVGNKSVRCDQPMDTSTKVTVKCKAFYEAPPESQDQQVTCNSNGQWSESILPCTLKCGEFDNEKNIPWYAAVLKKDNNKWNFACSASIVSSRVVISAAHCQWNEAESRLNPPDDFGVVVGKYDHGPRETFTNDVQQFEVEQIKVPEKFRGYVRRYSEDISIIILKKDIDLNEVVRPICIDFEDQYSQLFTPGKIGILASWGEPANKTYKQTIVSLPMVDFKDCVANIPVAFVTFLTYDKFCAGNVGSKSVCVGDSGAGYANQFRDGKWYLTGIASVGVSPEDGTACETKFYAGFTRVSVHRDFVRKNLPILANNSGSESHHSASRPGVNVQCGEDEFQCKSRECVKQSNVCDGKRHCSDDSDETYEECRLRGCPETSFRCRYGACIDRKLLCNGISDCADGSDEAAYLCGQGNISTPCSQTPSKGCTLPNNPIHGHYTLVGCTENAVPGTVVSVGVLLNYSCSPGFQLSGPSLVACYKGWSSELPSCNPVKCPPLKNPSRDIECVLYNTDIDCETLEVPVETRASVKCKSHYESIPGLQTYDMICESDGRWNKELQSCVPKCGVPNPKGVLFIAGSQDAQLAELPWHIGLYQPSENGTMVPSCGGSIVSTRIVVSAAHCFMKQGEKSFSQYAIVAGKYYYAWKNKTKYVQHLQIEDVIIPHKYGGVEKNYANDIAVIILKYEIQINAAVRPVCMDYDLTYLRYFSPRGTIGNVTGWGLNENQTFSNVLNIANLPYVGLEECERNTPDRFHAFLTNDKFCAGHLNQTNVCPGDSGGGYAVRFRDGRSYLVGIVSIGPSETCALYPYAAFTNVFNHVNFIRDIVYKYA